MAEVDWFELARAAELEWELVAKLELEPVFMSDCLKALPKYL